MMLRDQRGFTIIEVVIVAALMVIILAGGYAFYTAGQRMFHSGSEQADLHGQVRLAAEKIARELRFAEEVALLDGDWDPATAVTDNCNYLYYDTANRALAILDSCGTHIFSAGAISELLFFAEGKMLLITIKGESGSDDFLLESSVKPLNLKGAIGGPESARALQFSIPH